MSVFGVFWPVYSRILTEYKFIYSVKLRIKSICGKMWTRKTPNKNTFYAVIYNFLVSPSVKSVPVEHYIINSSMEFVIPSEVITIFIIYYVKGILMQI